MKVFLVAFYFQRGKSEFAQNSRSVMATEATEAVQHLELLHDMEGPSDQSNSSLSAANTPIKTASEQAEVVTDKLVSALNEAKMPNGNGDIVSGNLLEQLNASTGPSEILLSKYEGMWRFSSNNQTLSFSEAVRTMQKVERHTDETDPMTDTETTEMAIGLFKLSADDAWNFKDKDEAVDVITFMAGKASSINSRTDQQDVRYGSALSMTWTSEDTAIAFNASDMYQKYKPLLQALSLKRACVLFGPYLKAIVRLKMIIEKCDEEPLLPEPEQKPARAKATRQNQAKDAAAGSKALSTTKTRQAEAGADDGMPKKRKYPHSILENGKAGPQPSRKAKPGPPQSRHPPHVIDSTVEWLRSTKDIDSSLQRYHKSLVSMWTSGEFEWTRGYSVPSHTQVYYWIRNSRRICPPIEPLPKVSAKTQTDRSQQALRKLGNVFKARQFDYRGITSSQLALSKSFERVVLLFNLNRDFRSVLLLAQVSNQFNGRLVRMEYYAEVRRMVQGRNMDIDAQMVLNQIEYSEIRSEYTGERAVTTVPAKLPSSIQVLVDFSALSESKQEHAFNRFKGDYKDTIINLGDVLQTARLIFIGEGGFGSVFAIPERRVAIKIMKRPVSLQQAIKDVSSEAAALHIAATMNRISSGGMPSRRQTLPFSPLPATEVCASTSGALALPSWSMCDSHGLYYPALVMEAAVSTINEESIALSKSFFSDPMGNVSTEGFSRLASFIRMIAEPLAAMHGLNCAHRDLKEDNILALKVAAGVAGYIHYMTSGKKMTGRLGDCGKALYFGVEFHTECDNASIKAVSTARARKTAAAVAAPLFDQAIKLGEVKTPADMLGKHGTVPLTISMSLVHQIIPVAPSTQKTKDTAAAVKRKAPLYSGTIPYTPPETMPKLADGAKFLTARDYQPGDMWALGIMLANVLGGSGIRLAHLGSHDKKIFAQADDRVIWCKLNKLATALQEQKVPPEWTDVMDLLRFLTREEPAERMTAKEVLDHPFLKQAEKLRGHYF